MTFVTWKWPTVPGYRSTFGPETVNVLRAMVARHYPVPHRFCCVTNDSEGLDARVEVIPPWDDFKDLPSPSGGKNPSCYRRLRMFSRDIGAVFGPRFMSLDLDLVITGDLMPIVDRPEDFVILSDTNPRTFYNGSLILMNAGVRPQVWETFDPVKSPPLARAGGHFGSDQAWISHCLGKGEATWTKDDGVYSFKNHLLPNANGSELPSDARVVVFHGDYDPWDRRSQRLPWVQQHYRAELEVTA